MKRVLLLPDTRGWAYDVIAKSIAPYFKRYDPTIKYVGEVLAKKDSVNFDDYDVIMGFFWHDMLNLGPKIYKNYNPKKVCVGIHGHNAWIKRGIKQESVVESISKYAGVGCISRKLMRLFKKNAPVFTPSGYGDNFEYKPINSQERIKFLWVGDNNAKHHGDIKGFNDIIKPVFDSRDDVDLLIATKKNKIPYEDMHNFYYKGHVALCMSKNEGSPLPIIEAMACGRPVISTDVGVAPELITQGAGKIIGRSRRELNDAIDFFIKNKSSIGSMGAEARKSVEPRTWELSARSYEKLFDKVRA